MSLATWKRLADFEASIKADFTNTTVCTKDCPVIPRVHLVYAHYAARPDVDKNVADLWPFVTLKAYKACTEPQYQQVALDFLATHFLWMRLKGMMVDTFFHDSGKLAVPPAHVPAPTEVDGGMLVHFDNTNFTEPGVVHARIQSPHLIDEKPRIEQYGLVVASQTHPPAPLDAKGKPAVGKDGKPLPAPASVAGPSTPDQSGGDVESDTGYPKRRRFCLSQVGATGDHFDDDNTTDMDQIELAYLTPHQDSTLRLFCVAPGFKFTLLKSPRHAADRKAELDALNPPADPPPPSDPPPAPDPKGKGKGKKPAPKPPVVDAAALKELQKYFSTDPWNNNTREMGTGRQIYEMSSGVTVGDLVPSGYGDGVQKLWNDPGVTNAEDLGNRYAGQLGASRVLVFSAIKKVEGGCESIQTYDGPKISWGINQWTFDKTKVNGELFQIMAFIYDFFPDAFARRFAYYGFGVWFKSRNKKFAARTAYNDVIVYRVPCCGKPIRGACDAILVDALTEKADDATDDTPPPQARPLAISLRLNGVDTISMAMCYVFTTAGADPEIQKAMAQWMSYRISSLELTDRLTLDVVKAFLHDLGASISDQQRNTMISDVTGLDSAKWSDADADEGWINWETRCKDAGKTTIGAGAGAVGGTKTHAKSPVKPAAPAAPAAPKK